MQYAKRLLCITLFPLLTACGKLDNAQTLYQAGAAILSSPGQGIPALSKLLRENLRVEDGVVVVDGPLVTGAVTLSRNSPWSVSCGEGLTVDFGKGEIGLISIMVPIDDSKCAFLTRRLGQEVQAIVEGTSGSKLN